MPEWSNKMTLDSEQVQLVTERGPAQGICFIHPPGEDSDLSNIDCGYCLPHPVSVKT